MIKLSITINAKPVMESGLLNFVESRLGQSLKEGDAVSFFIEDTSAEEGRKQYTEIKHFKVIPKG